MKWFAIVLSLTIFVPTYAQKIDTIAFKDGTYLLKKGDEFRKDITYQKMKQLWLEVPLAHQDILRGLYHNWQALIGLKRESLVDLIGQPNLLLPDRYIYNFEITPDGIFTGCWLGVGYTNGKISYLGVGCPN